MKNTDRIKELEQQLKEAKGYTYVHEITCMHCVDGELHIEYGSGKELRWIVFNVEALYSDLPFIIDQVVKEQHKSQIMILNQIKDSITEL